MNADEKLDRVLSILSSPETAQELEASTQDLERGIGPVRRLLRVSGWIVGLLAAAASVGAGWQTISDSIATDVELDDRVSPIEDRVERVERDVGNVSRGVTQLLEDQARERKATNLRRRLEYFDRAYEQEMAEYTATVAAGRRWHGPRPRKSPQHLELEAQVAGLNPTP